MDSKTSNFYFGQAGKQLCLGRKQWERPLPTVAVAGSQPGPGEGSGRKLSWGLSEEQSRAEGGAGPGLRTAQGQQGHVFPASVRRWLSPDQWLGPAALLANYGLAGKSQGESQQTPSSQLVMEKIICRRLNSYSIARQPSTHAFNICLVSIYHVQGCMYKQATVPVTTVR